VERPTARSFVLDLLSTLGRGAMPVRALVGAAALFGVAENNLRVALARLLASGRIERDERGQYRLGASAAAVRRQVAAWRTVEERVRPWPGTWIGVLTTGLPRADRRRLRLRTRALRLLGFRELAPGLAIRPDNLVGGVPEVRDHLRDLGLDPAAVVLLLGDLDAATDARARRLWNTAALRAVYRTTCAALARSERRLPGLPPERAMVESFLLGGRAIRAIVLDPLLPEPLVPARERAALVEAMRRYDRVGRSAWASLLGAAGMATVRTPATLRMIGAPGHLAAAGGVR
jgi:phenylacetic acid degradation operon negative regulatory protein